MSHAKSNPQPAHNLPSCPEPGFFGREAEIEAIAQAFAQGARGCALGGPGGQGKTCLAVETARRLLHAGRFTHVCFVEYAHFAGRDPLDPALNALGTLLETHLRDRADAARALAGTPLLLVLDGLDALPPEGRGTLLDAAEEWTAGNSRALLTARAPLWAAPEASAPFRAWPLAGLAESDGMDYFTHLLLAPPAVRADLPDPLELRELLAELGYQPLALARLVYPFKTRPFAEIRAYLSRALAGAGPAAACLALLLDGLGPPLRRWLAHLGVFQDGALEDLLIEATGLGEIEAHPTVAQGKRLLAAIDGGDPLDIAQAMGLPLPEVSLPPEHARQIIDIGQKNAPRLRAELAKARAGLAESAGQVDWTRVRPLLLDSGLLRAEPVLGHPAPYLYFQPGLAAALWAELPPAARPAAQARYRRAYARLAEALFRQDTRQPLQARLLAQRELPNLLGAAYAALEAGDEAAPDFAEHLGHFLAGCGHELERAALLRHAATQPRAVAGEYYRMALALRDQAGRLDEARRLAERALHLQAGLEAGRARVWKTQRLLADLHARQDNPAQAAHYRAQAQASHAEFLAAHPKLRRQAQLIVAVAATVRKPQNRLNLENGLAQMAQHGWDKLVAAVSALLDGERAAETLCAALDQEDAEVIRAVLDGLEEPACLEPFVQALESVAENPAPQLSPQQARLILALVAGLAQPKLQPYLENVFAHMERKGWQSLVAAVRRIQAGERDAQALGEALDDGDRLIVRTILRGLEDPRSLQSLL